MYELKLIERYETRRQKRALQRYLILGALLMSFLILSPPSASGQQKLSEPFDPWADAIAGLDPDALYAGADVIRTLEALRSVALKLVEEATLSAAQEVRAQIEPALRAALVYKVEYERLRKLLVWIPAAAVAGLIAGFVLSML